MLAFSGETLSDTDLCYLAFRVSFQETLEHFAFARTSNDDLFDDFGFLTEVPFLRNVAPQVQLDLLAATWRKHVSRRTVEATLIDESVMYAVCETAANLADDHPTVITHAIISGPQSVSIAVDGALADSFRRLHLSLPSEGDFLLISQFEDMAPDDADEAKEQLCFDTVRQTELFDVLGRWVVSHDLFADLEGLLTEREIARTNEILFV